MIVGRSADRYLTEGDATRTWHTFSYGKHYDPGNVGFGPLVAINEELVAPGGGYDDHHHADVEIVTWVLEGALAHEDSTGQRGTVVPGVAQRLSAGSGVTHAERNASGDARLRFVQMMLRSRNWDAPEYAQAVVPAGPGVHLTVPVNADAALLVARPSPGRPVRIEAPHGFLALVTRGVVEAAGHRLEPGDHLASEEAVVVEITATEPAEVLAWVVTVGGQG